MNTHYEVVYKYHRGPNEIQQRSNGSHFHSAEEAREEVLRQYRKNDHFVEVEGFTPFVSDVKILRVTTETEVVEFPVCPYTMSHTKHFCGYEGCRES